MAKMSRNLTPGAKTTAPQGGNENLQVPAPATLPPGVTSGRPPLPTGQAVVARNPLRMTEEERKKLESVGWKAGQPIPPGMADVIATVEAEAKEQAAASVHVLPVDPATPPTVLNTVNIENMKPEERARYQAAINDALQKQATSQAEAAAQAQLARNMSGPAGQIAAAKVLPVDDRTPPARPAPPGSVVPDPHYRPPAPAAAPAPETAAPVAADPVATAGQFRTEEPVAPRTNCQHCGWDLKQNDTPEPEQVEKISFLHCKLGQKPFTKDYSLMGDMLVATFRELTSKEIDAVFQQAFRERERGLLVGEYDYFERVNRLRLFLQLTRLRTKVDATTGGFDHDLPDSLSAYHNPNFEATWVSDPIPEEPLKLVEEEMLTKVMPTESMHRILQLRCNAFNRLTAKLEANVENEGFWKATGQPS